MKTILVTGWCGTLFAKMACWTLPLLEAYAARHGMDFFCANLAGDRPPSWMKVPLLHRVLQDYDRAVWVDADVVVLDPSENILDAVPSDSWQGLVEHFTDSGTVPNCGVWVLGREMATLLAEIWNAGTFVNHCWWEQAAVLERMGYTVTNEPTATFTQATELHQRTTFLPAAWNHHPYDARKVDAPRFVHVTAYADRPAACKYFAEMAAT